MSRGAQTIDPSLTLQSLGRCPELRQDRRSSGVASGLSGCGSALIGQKRQSVREGTCQRHQGACRDEHSTACRYLGNLHILKATQELASLRLAPCHCHIFRTPWSKDGQESPLRTSEGPSGLPQPCGDRLRLPKAPRTRLGASTSDLPGSTAASLTITSPRKRPISPGSASAASIFSRLSFSPSLW